MSERDEGDLTPGEKQFDKFLEESGYIKTKKSEPTIAPASSITFTTGSNNTSGSWNLYTYGQNLGIKVVDPQSDTIALQKQLLDLTNEYHKVLDEKSKLEKRVENQEHSYGELQEAHDSLRKVVECLPDLSEADGADGLRNNSLDHAFCIDDDYYMDRDDAISKLYESAHKEINNCRNEFKIALANNSEALNWDRFTLGEKVEKLNAGMNVWSASTGVGPLRTIVESKAEIGKKESTFGVWCQHSNGRIKKYYVADLLPYNPKIKRPSKINLFASTIIAGSMASYAAYTAFGLKGAVIAGIAQTALMLVQMREYSKA